MSREEFAKKMQARLAELEPLLARPAQPEANTATKAAVQTPQPTHTTKRPPSDLERRMQAALAQIQNQE